MNPNNFAIREAHTDQVSLFTLPYTDTAVESIKEQVFKPVSQLTGDNPVIEFNVPGNNTQYLDLSKTRLQVQIKVVQQDGSNLIETDKTAPINLLLHTMFAQVDLFLNQVQVGKHAPPTYALKSYMDVLLNNGKEAKDTELVSQGWYKDSADAMDEIDPTLGSANGGLVNRYVHIKGSKIWELEGRPDIDFFKQKRYLLNGVSVNLKFWQTSNPFRLMTNDATKGYKVQVVDAQLKVVSINLMDEVIVGHNQILEKEKKMALYPYIQSDVKVYSIAKGLYNYTCDNIWQSGDVPSKLLIALIPSQSFNGDYKRNPLNLVHENLEYVCYTIDGIPRPVRCFKPDFPNGHYTDCYLTLFGEGHQPNDVSMTDYKGGYTIVYLDMDQHHSENLFPLPSKGHSRLELTFKEALPESLNLLLYAKYPTVLKIDAARNIIM